MTDYPVKQIRQSENPNIAAVVSRFRTEDCNSLKNGGPIPLVDYLDERYPATLHGILDAVIDEFGFSSRELRGKRRLADIVQARRAYAWLARYCTNASTPKIGRMINRDHTTVLHHLKFVEADMGAETKLARRINDLRMQIAGQQIRREAST